MGLNSKKDVILFIDSGIGGLSTLAESLKLFSHNIIYYAENQHSPYGTKSKDFLQSILVSIISQHLCIYNIKCVVLACNTATTSSISFLRNKFPNLPIIGTEPAIKLAKDQGFKNPAIIATPQTIKNVSHSLNITCKLIPCPDLATAIENAFVVGSIFYKFKLIKIIYKIKKKISGCDCIILGCTHYSLIKHLLLKSLHIPLLDGNIGVSRRIFDLINTKSQSISHCKFILSRPNKTHKQKYKKILKQILANRINLW